MNRERTTERLTHRPSWGLLYQGTAEEFIEALCADVAQHPAVDHPYLERLARGDLPDMHAAIRDYCHQYYFYSAGFTRYLGAVIEGLDSTHHRDVLRQNLDEEQGRGAGNPEGIPHSELFRRFRRAAGVTADYDASTPPCTTVLVWRDLFLQKCQSRQPGVGLAAIGLGTEMVVSTIYSRLYRAVTMHTDMKVDDYLFLSLHLDCDDEHASQMKQICLELAEDQACREALRFGALSSLNLRNAFWDVMLARALAA